MSFHLAPIDGFGVLARHDDAAIVILATDARVDAILDAWGRSAGDDLADRLTAEALGLGPVLPPLAAVRASGGGWELLAAGGMSIRWENDEGEHLLESLADPVVTAVGESIDLIVATAIGTSPVADPRVRLDAGTVRASGFVIAMDSPGDGRHRPGTPGERVDPTAPHDLGGGIPAASAVDRRATGEQSAVGPDGIPSVVGSTPGGDTGSARLAGRLGTPGPPAPPAPPAIAADEPAGDPDPPVGPSGRILLLDSPAPNRPPLPLASHGGQVARDTDDVLVGIRCPEGHLNDPDAYYCAQCGLDLLHTTHQLSEGRRPSLGFLVLDDGSAYTVDSDYVIGRAPHDDPLVDEGHLRPLTIDDRSRTVSRVHAEIRLNGWHVHLVDRGSTNGSYLWDEADDSWRRLAVGEEVPLTPGTHAAVGQRVFRFEAPQQQLR